MVKIQVIFVFSLVCLSHAQFDGSFWWKNKDLVNSASHSRSLKDQTAKIRTLPPKYRHEDVSTTTTTTSRTIFTDESEEDKANYKFDDEPDCVCVPKYLCNENNILITDGSGIIDERSFNLCGKDNVCCKLPRVTPSTTGTPIPVKISTTTQKNFFNFNINNITSLISTILKPIQPQHNHNSTVVHQSAPVKCISKKGSKLQERILINPNEDEEEEENNKLTGTAAFLEYPWMIEILKKNIQKRNFEYKCGGVLIGMHTVLTAYHCLKSKISSNFIVRAGEWDRSSLLEFIPHQDRIVTHIISHPQYYSGGLYNDIAILKFEPFKSDVNVQPLCLPDETDIVTSGHYCIVTAWGSVSETQKTSDKLRFVKVPIVDRKKCEKKFQTTKLGTRFKLHESFVCAGGEEGLDSCTNDGGSPLICSNGESYFLQGLVSWGLGCGERGIPGIYTNIPHLLKWIKNHI